MADSNQHHQHQHESHMRGPVPIASCSDTVLETIQHENISPRPRWYFILKNEFFWGAGVISVMIGSCAVAAILFAMTQSDYDLYVATHDSFGGFLLDAFPYMWTLSLALLIMIGYVQVKYTTHGYKYPLYLIAGGIFVLTTIGGVTLHIFGFGAYIERTFGPYLPFYSTVQHDRERIWVNAGRGIIAGHIQSISPDMQSFVLTDFRGNPWIIQGQQLGDMDAQLMHLNNTVRIIGLPESVVISDSATSTMFGCAVLPWQKNSEYIRSHNVQDMNRTEHDVSSELLATFDARFDHTQFVPEMRLRIHTEEEKNMEELRAEHERKEINARTTTCKDVRPYQFIMQMRTEASY